MEWNPNWNLVVIWTRVKFFVGDCWLIVFLFWVNIIRCGTVGLTGGNCDGVKDHLMPLFVHHGPGFCAYYEWGLLLGTTHWHLTEVPTVGPNHFRYVCFGVWRGPGIIASLSTTWNLHKSQAGLVHSTKIGQTRPTDWHWPQKTNTLSVLATVVISPAE